MREVVALRCLEELCGPRIEIADKGSLEDTGSNLDLSKSCEEVLASVFRDDSVSDLKEAEKELLKCDIGSFLEHKRASMPLTALQRLNMKITEGARLQASPLTDVVGLASRNTGGGASAEHHEPGLDTDRSNSCDSEGVTGNLIPMPMEQRDNWTKECDDARISPRAKRSRTDLAMENLEESFDDLRHSNGRSTDDHSIAKKLKQCQPRDLDSDPTIVPDSFDSPPKESTDLEEDRIRTSEEGQILGGRAEFVTLQSANSPDKYKNSVDTDDLLDKIDDTSTEKAKMNESSSTSLNKEMESRQTECLPARHDTEKMSSNTDLHIDVAEHDRKKLEFLNCVTEQNVCMKCIEGGQLMVCHSSTCPLVVHENCVGLSATFDTDGNFHCPFCSCSTAIMEYVDSVKEASTAWQELVAFCSDALIHQPDRLYLVLEQHQSVHGRDEIVEECDNVLRKRRTEAEPDGYGDDSVQVCNYYEKGTEGGDKDKSEPSPRICSKKNNKDFLLGQGSEEKENGDTDMTDNKNSKLDLQSPEKGVEKYSEKSGISWTNILVFGGDLLKGRTTRDLKNRWNNMRRKAGK